MTYSQTKHPVMLEQVSLMLKLHQDIPDLIMAEDLTSYFSPALQRINLDNFAEIFDMSKSITIGVRTLQINFFHFLEFIEGDCKTIFRPSIVQE
jgi:hypothetical protein